jgi:hypothetical protein
MEWKEFNKVWGRIIAYLIALCFTMGLIFVIILLAKYISKLV